MRSQGGSFAGTSFGASVFDGLKRKILFAKLASILDKVRRKLEGQQVEGSGEFLGWSMDKWKKWLEAGLIVMVAAMVGAFADALSVYAACMQDPTAVCVFNIKAVGASSVAAGIAAFLAWLRMSPSDPRRTQ